MTRVAQVEGPREGGGSAGLMLLPCDAAGVSGARSAFVDEVRQWLPATLQDDAGLVVSELLSNAVRHASPLPNGKLRLTWRREPSGGVEVAVTDGGAATRPQQRHPSLSALGGRGLTIVGALSSSWGIRNEDPGVTVWARVGPQGGVSPAEGTR